MTAYILNILDLALTLYALQLGAVELNPIMNFVIGIHPLLFLFVKTVPAYLLCRWLENNARKTKAARVRFNIITIIYAAVVANNLIVILALKGAN